MSGVELFSGRGLVWWINEAGIFLEIVGAILIVFAAFRTRKHIKDIGDIWKPSLAEQLRDVISNQAFTELKGFGLLAVGLICQMIGGFDG